MNIIHYTPTNYESGSLGGVARFDHELRKVFPQLKSILRQSNAPWFTFNPNETIVITDHSFIKEIPTQFKIIAVHHGMAAEHKQRNPDWNGDLYVQQQQGMKDRNKTWFVGISKFTQDAAKKHHDIIDDIVILHAVDTVPITKPKQGYNVIGDWRTPSKGRDLIQKLREECPEFIFNQLSCGKYDKANGYANQNIYLSLSACEGNSYAVMDAIACGIPVVATDVGLFGGDYDKRLGEIISWKDRANVSVVKEQLHNLYNSYEKYNPTEWMNETIPFDQWKILWQDFVEEIYAV
jgi:glycosyltransferase involved in cell wall biosynthesis